MPPISPRLRASSSNLKLPRSETALRQPRKDMATLAGDLDDRKNAKSEPDKKAITRSFLLRLSDEPIRPSPRARFTGAKVNYHSTSGGHPDVSVASPSEGL